MKKENFIKKIFDFIRKFFIKTCIYIYRFIKYVWYGLIWPIILLVTTSINLLYYETFFFVKFTSFYEKR